MKTLLMALALLLACAPNGRHSAIQAGTTGAACAENGAWSHATIEVRIRESLIGRMRLETMQTACVALTRLPEEVHFRVRLLGQRLWTISEKVLVQAGQTALLEIDERPNGPLLWVSLR